MVVVMIMMAENFWFCALSGYLTIATCIALSFAVVCISSTVIKMLQGNPVSDRTILWWGIMSWGVGFLLATIFAANNLMGSYKGLYCLIPSHYYRFYATAPVIITVAVCLALMINNYWQAYSMVRNSERMYEGDSESAYTNKASKVILKNGLTVIGTYYVRYIKSERDVVVGMAVLMNVSFSPALLSFPLLYLPVISSSLCVPLPMPWEARCPLNLTRSHH